METSVIAACQDREGWGVWQGLFKGLGGAGGLGCRSSIYRHDGITQQVKVYKGFRFRGLTEQASGGTVR